ncbi:hypothetical protein HPT25_24305 [Bacillus sp. BRMEA1]|uniref:hypothetical protein n=1 Tax=Neobacillus endophyticus TaxID=2738405 RepID=UPI0015638B8D|nr:hypothetical protein [Neobacillus endophyticus]NRD80449.1 hypothetical protein [Neobacillus endophyticus]
MSKLESKLEALLEDVNQEDGHTLRIMSKMTDSMYLLIKWAGIPFVIYLFLEIMRW